MSVVNKYMRFFVFLFLGVTSVYAHAQKDPSDIQLLGTRSWIRVTWNPAPGVDEYRIYYSEKKTKPGKPVAIVPSNQLQYYIQNAKTNKLYHVWVETWYKNGIKKISTKTVITQKQWVLDPKELEELERNPSSAAVPKGMRLFWQDEFNDALLNRNKWTTHYFSSLNYLSNISKNEMLGDKLPQPAFELNGNTINLYVNDTLPARLYVPTGSQKISSIQTYDWRTNENLLNNSRGGYFEVKVKRSKKGSPKGTNTAFWFDSPGPDLKYYLEKGTVLAGVAGIRPTGQLFEIDVFELLNAQFVLHGHVDKNGKFIRNLNTHIAEGFQHENEWVTHGMLWTPTAIEHYINGKLIKAYTDKHQIYSPNHFMNVFLGTYGSEGGVNMEVDYIRYYTWPLSNGNELPNSGFEDSGSLSPWEGNGKVQPGRGKNHSAGVLLRPGEKIEQYVYLKNDVNYQLNYWSKGKGQLQVVVNRVTEVSGELSEQIKANASVKTSFGINSLSFKTDRDYKQNMKTIQVLFSNEGKEEIILDEITIKKK